MQSLFKIEIFLRLKIWFNKCKLQSIYLLFKTAFAKCRTLKLVYFSWQSVWFWVWFHSFQMEIDVWLKPVWFADLGRAFTVLLACLKSSASVCLPSVCLWVTMRDFSSWPHLCSLSLTNRSSHCTTEEMNYLTIL